MAEWVYKAKKTKASHDDTLDLAGVHNFLCRSAFERGAGGAGLRPVAKVTEVAVGDTIHYYCRRTDGTIATFGSYLVGEASKVPGVFAPTEEAGALVSVVEPTENPKLLARLERGFDRDPKLELYTGWVVHRIPAPATPPRFDQNRLFPGPMTNLWPFPDATLPRSKTKA